MFNKYTRNNETYIRIYSKPTSSRLRRISTHKPTLFDFQLLVFNFYLLVFQLPPPTPPYTEEELITKRFLPLCKGELVGVVGNYKICNFTPNERLRMSHVLTYLFVALLMT